MKPLMMIVLTLLTLLSCSKEIGSFEQTPQPPQQPTPPPIITQYTMKITVENASFTATLSNNGAVSAFKALLPLTLNMSDFNRNEKVASLPRSLPTSSYNPHTINTGDIMLYGSSSLVLFYEGFTTSYSYTRIGVVNDVSGFRSALGGGDVTIKFELE